jgi:hypothetical protein
MSERIERGLAWLESAGLGSSWAQRIAYWVKHFGAMKAAGILIAVTFPLLKFVWLPYLGTSAAETLAEGVGLNLTVGDWSADVFDLKLTARDLEIKARGHYAQAEVLKADSVSFDLSLARRFRTGDWLDEVIVEKPVLYVERQISGRWNWEDVIEAQQSSPPSNGTGNASSPVRYDTRPAEREAPDAEPAGGWFTFFPHVTIHGLRIQWVENQPARSGSGLIQNAQSTLFVDDVEILAENVPLSSAKRGPSSFSLSGRTADGRVEVKGAVDFNRFPSRPDVPGTQSYRVASASAPTTPSLHTSLYIENVGVAALARMVPSLSIVPSAGAVTGKVEMAVRQRDLDCKADLVLTNVAYVPDPDSPAVRGRIEVIQQSLKDFRANGRIASNCSGSLNDTGYRPINAISVATTQQAVRTAPPVVQQAAAFDYQTLSGQAADTALAGVAGAITEKMTQAAVGALGGQVGGAEARSSTRPAPKTNPVAGGVKKIGSGIKGLFGKKKNK